MTNLNSIDQKIQLGYEMVHEAEWHFVNSGYLYKYIAKDLKILRDSGINRFEDERGAGNKKEAPSNFLRSFYQNKHEDRKERYLQWFWIREWLYENWLIRIECIEVIRMFDCVDFNTLMINI